MVYGFIFLNNFEGHRSEGIMVTTSLTQCSLNWKKNIIFYIKYLNNENFLQHEILIKRHFFTFFVWLHALKNIQMF